MRLTLRTLLAWLDDTLQPPQVKEIGGQVSGSPFAQELTERIHKVTRQRRLSVPSSSGPEGIDPNLVASYLDNELDSDAVAEYEKKCLSHDVVLAEVASVHQILSLLGHKVKVPAAARSRMYQLVKGREANREPRPGRPRADLPEPLSTPINPWVVAEAPRRPGFQRFGPGLVCLLLIALASFTAWKSLTAEPPEGFRPMLPDDGLAKALVARPATKAPEVAVVTKDSPAPAGEEPTDAPDVAAGARAPAAGMPEAGAAPEKTTEPGAAGVAKVDDSAAKEAAPLPKPAVTAGSAGLAAAPEGILMRYNSDSREWERLTGATPLAIGNRLLCLIPSRAEITVGKAKLVMVGESEIRILPQSTDQVPAIELAQGRLLFRPESSGSLKVGLGDRLITVEVPQNGSAALERPARWVYGRMISPVPPLVIYSTSGDVAVSTGGKQESISPLDVLTIDRGDWKRSTIEEMPPWAGDSAQSPEDIKARDQFSKIFHAGRPVLTEIVAALEDNGVANKQLSILALKSMGEMSYLMPLLSRKDEPAVRKGALAAIRSHTALGPAASGAVREQLVAEFGEEKASVVGKMLVGFSSQEAASPQLLGQLVALLSPEEESVGVRELALDTLKQLTGRESEGYDPDHPEGKGLSTWMDLERQGKLRVAAPRTKAK